MLELSSARKNKVNLSDYNWNEDINSRILMSDFSVFDIEVLEEILFSSLKVSLKKLAKNLGAEEAPLTKSLKRISLTGLLEIKDDLILVDKEKRKYFEFEINRFSEDFKPDMEFLQGLLKKVPIHILPTWYAIPRTSNNIFDSIVEKYLLSPAIYQRYLSELNFGNPVLESIINDVFYSTDLKVSTSDLISKYNLKRADFEEIMLLLEFNFVCCLCYERQDDHWHEYVTPFYEWTTYLNFLKATECPKISNVNQIERTFDSDFAFIEEMEGLLQKAKDKPYPAQTSPALEKICLVHLGEYRDGALHIQESGLNWLKLSLENRSLYLYRHPQNRILSLPAADRFIREAEKSVKRVLHGDWVYFDDFVKGVLVPLSEDSVTALIRVGKQWKYHFPVYGDAEKAIIRATIFEWLFELGVVTYGKCEGKDCFAVTPFGSLFFSD